MTVDARPSGDAGATDLPLVTVVMTCYNHGRYLPDAIASIRAQTWPHIEMILVDDGSTDETAAIVAQFDDVTYIWQANQGPSGARNTAIERARGEFIAFLDADDLFYPEGIEAGVRDLQAHPDCAFTFGRNRRVTMDGKLLLEDLVHPMDPDGYTTFLRRNIIGSHASILYRTELLRRVGGFDVSLRACEDHELYLRLVRQYSFSRHLTFVTDYRFHNTNSTRNAARMLGWYQQMDRMQRPYIAGNQRRTAALDLGTRIASEYYGILAMKGIVGSIVRRRPGDALRDARTLMTEYPQAPLLAAQSVIKRGPAAIKRRLRRVRGLLRAVGNTDRITTPSPQPDLAAPSRPHLERQIARYLFRQADQLRGTLLEVGTGVLSRPYRAQLRERTVLHIQHGQIPIAIGADSDPSPGANGATTHTQGAQANPEAPMLPAASITWFLCADVYAHGVTLASLPRIEALLQVNGRAVLGGIDHFGTPTDDANAILQRVRATCPNLSVEPHPPLLAAEILGLTHNADAAHQRDTSRVLILRKHAAE